jgi:hypothetical protein
VIVSGMVAAVPGQGGAAWAVLQYVLGLRRLGHEVLFVEQLDAPGDAPLAQSGAAAYFENLARDFGLEQSSALVVTGTRETVGLPYSELAEFATGADVVLDISGYLTDESLLGPAPVRAYLDLDPAFTQLWQDQGIDMRFGGHTHFVTVGQAIGTPACDVPAAGVEWIPTLPPVVLEQWPRATEIRHDALTTIANWRGYGSVQHGDVHYGQKVHSLRLFMNLPQHTRERFVLALAIHPDEKKDLELLDRGGWELVSAEAEAGTPQQYQRFIQGSKGEFGISKSGYVLSRCGWFSDRSACYLASGRPVIAQETGFSRFLPTGEGLFAFSRGEDVLEAIARIEADYERQARAARRLAEQQLDSDVVLPRLLERLGVA